LRNIGAYRLLQEYQIVRNLRLLINKGGRPEIRDW
jgi:hypothetical protein